MSTFTLDNHAGGLRWFSVVHRLSVSRSAPRYCLPRPDRRRRRTRSSAFRPWTDRPTRGSELARGGATTEAVRAAFAKVGYEINVAYRPWKRAIDMAKKGTDDVTNLKKLVRKRIDAVVIDKLVL